MLNAKLTLRTFLASVVAVALLFLMSTGSGALAGLPRSTELGSGLATQKPPTAYFTYDCVDLTCRFEADYVYPPGSFYVWDFGDDSAFGVGRIISHTFPEPDTYPVTLTAGNLGGQDSYTALITVPAPPMPPNIRLVASYVPEPGAPRVERESTDGNYHTPFEFYYAEWEGNFEERPGGACDIGSENPTYLKVQYRGNVAFDKCRFRASWDNDWDSEWASCPDPVQAGLNDGQSYVINTDLYGVDVIAPGTCEPSSAVHLPYNEDAWLKVDFKYNGTWYPRRLDFRKVIWERQ